MVRLVLGPLRAPLTLLPKLARLRLVEALPIAVEELALACREFWQFHVSAQQYRQQLLDRYCLT
jgi:hypothetical protein